MSRKTPIAQRVLADIQEDIVNGVIKDGEVITERLLEQRYNASRTPIKEALKFLEKEGWVEITPRQETRVTSFGISEIQETLPIRMALEGIAVKLCIQNMNAEIRTNFEQLLRDLEKLDEKIEKQTLDCLDIYNELDNRFHLMIYHYSNNRILRNFSNSLRSLFKRIYRNIPLPFERIQDGAHELQQIIRNMLGNEILLAETNITKHIINSIDQKIAALKDSHTPTFETASEENGEKKGEVPDRIWINT